MKRIKWLAGLVLGTATFILAGGLGNTASAGPGACNPVKAYTPVKPVAPPPVPACGPVKTCEPVHDKLSTARLHDHVARLLHPTWLGSHLGKRGVVEKGSSVTPPPAPVGKTSAPAPEPVTVRGGR